MKVHLKFLHIFSLIWLVLLFGACQNKSGEDNMQIIKQLDKNQYQVLKSWFETNGLSETSFHFGDENHKGSYSVLIKNSQVVSIKSKAVKSTSGLAALPSLLSLELSLEDSAGLTECPFDLDHLRINNLSSVPVSLDFVNQCPGLKELELYYTQIKDWHSLNLLAELHSLSVRHSKISSVEFTESLPNLRRLTLTNNQLQSLSFSAPQENLKEIFLSDNQFRMAPDLSTLNALETLSLDNNPLPEISKHHLPQSLKYLDLRNTAVTDLEPLVAMNQLQRVLVQRIPRSLHSELTEKIVAAEDESSQLAIAEDLMQKYLGGIIFIEKLPKSVNGKALDLSKSTSQHFSMSGTSNLSGEISISEIQGLMRIPLAQTDELLYQQRQVSIKGKVQVSQGTFRIYSPVHLDFWQMASIFADNPKPNPPESSDLTRKGFIVYEAQPNQELTFQANLIPMADRYLLLVGSDVATGVSIRYE